MLSSRNRFATIKAIPSKQLKPTSLNEIFIQHDPPQDLKTTPSNIEIIIFGKEKPIVDSFG